MLWRQKLVVVGIIAVFVVIGFGLSLAQSESYEAEASVVITDPNTARELTDQMGLERSAARNLNNQAALMESIDVSVSATTVSGTGIIVVVATSPTATGAVDNIVAMFGEYTSSMQESADVAAAELLDQYAARRTELTQEITGLEAAIQAEPERQDLRSQISSATSTLRGVENGEVRVKNQLANYGNGVQTYTPPETPTAPTESSPVRNAIIAAVLGLLIATGVAWVRGANA